MTDLHRQGHSIVSGRPLIERIADTNRARWLPDAMRAELVCMSGARASVTVHADEIEELRKPEVLRTLWVKAWRTSRAEIAAGRYENEERRDKARVVNDAIYSRPPVGLLCWRRWMDIAKESR